MTNRCVKCWDAFEADYKGNVCDGCTSVVPGFPGLQKNRILGKGTHWENKMTEEEINEIKRNVSIPTGEGASGKGWASGRRGENGRIAEKPIKF